MSWRDPFTPRHLVELARDAEKKKWDHTAQLLAKVHNLTAKSPKPAEYFNPYRAPRTQARTGLTLGEFVAELKRLEEECDDH